MKIRYYLRGLGLGILVTAIFFMVSGKNSQPMSDEMIKARAKELGMSESVVLSELSTEEETAEENTTEITTNEEATTEQVEEETTVTEETVTEETVSEEPVSEETEAEETSSEEAVSEDSTEETVVEVASQSSSTQEAKPESETPENAASNTEPVTITVNRGEGSDTVSRRLQEAGLVADAHEYDKYLMANGYDKRIGAGEHVIPAGATWEDIAKTLCNMR